MTDIGFEIDPGSASWLLGSTSGLGIVYDDEGKAIGWRFHLPDDSVMMVPLVALPE